MYPLGYVLPHEVPNGRAVRYYHMTHESVKHLKVEEHDFMQKHETLSRDFMFGSSFLLL